MSRSTGPTTRRTSRRTSRRAQGFTLIEVMMAMVVMVIGLMGVVGLQLHVIRMNNEARQFTQAMTIAESWSNRLKIDALNWTQVIPVGQTLPVTLGGGRYLASMDPPTSVTLANNFMTFTDRGVPVTLASAYHNDRLNFQGRDLGASDLATDTVFCVSTRLGWVYFGNVIRADVRVYWPKKIAAVINTHQGACAVPNPGSAEDLSQYHVIYLPNVIRVTELRD